jgi:hypothetical protein
MIKARRALFAALPLFAMSLPAMAANLSGNYLVTLNKARPSQYSGASVCITLAETGTVLGWTNSGNWSINGIPAGQYYVLHGVISLVTTASVTNAEAAPGYAIFEGKLLNKAITDTSVTEVIGGQVALTGNFTATPGGC